MSVFSFRGLGLCVPLVMIAHSAQADLTAEDVWSDWKSYLATSGYTISATEQLAASTLMVSDITMVMDQGQDADFTVTLGNLRFEENGDGTVKVVLPDELPIGFTADIEGDDDVSGTVLYTHSGMKFTVSGEPEALVHDFSANSAKMTLEELTIEGEPLSEEIETSEIELSMSGISSRTEMTLEELRKYTQKVALDQVDYKVLLADSEAGFDFNFSGSLNDLKIDGFSEVPEVGEEYDVTEMLTNGLKYLGKFTYSDGSSRMVGNDDGNTFNVETTSANGSVDVAMSAEGLVYAIEGNDASVSIQGSDVPFPIAVTLRQMGMNIAMPLTKSDNVQDFALGLSLRDFAVPDLLWGMIDPAGELPRDPANLVVDLTGKGKLLFDMMDEGDLAAVEAGEIAPGELNGITIQKVLLSAAGAEVNGTGDFSFNNADLETFDGFPAPSGEANLELIGANTLIDKLIGMGLVSESDAMGARMMMGLFTTPGEDEDTLTSKIEVTEDGQVLANGQRLR